MSNAIVIGATSGIGRALAVELARQGWNVGATGRRVELLEELQKEIMNSRGERRLPSNVVIKYMDVSQTEEAMKILEELISEMGGAELIIINAGVGYTNPELRWDWEKETVDINVRGFAACTNTAVNYLVRAGRGHLVGISSIASLKGYWSSAAYGASKAFMSLYLEAMAHKAARLKLPIHVTDVRPGYVDTPMIQGDEGLFWVASPEKAARQILKAIQNKKRIVYITKRWNLIAWLIQCTPWWIYKRIR